MTLSIIETKCTVMTIQLLIYFILSFGFCFGVELVRTKEKMADYMNSASLHDQMVRELQAREADLHEALKAKDSQLAVLRVRLEDADRNISEHKKETDRLQTEKER